jgi:hypothetical protein
MRKFNGKKHPCDEVVLVVYLTIRVSVFDYVVSKRRLENNEMERIWKEAPAD